MVHRILAKSVNGVRNSLVFLRVKVLRKTRNSIGTKNWFRISCFERLNYSFAFFGYRQRG